MTAKRFVIVGPTGTGKSALGLLLAQRFHGEIINADSRQVYIGMDIGTAKPSAAERRIVPHHLFDIVRPDEPFSIAEYRLAFEQTVAAIEARGNLPIAVGGSGLYVRAVLDGLRPPAVAPNPDLRADLERLAAEHGTGPLEDELRRSDPVAADKIDPRNIRRLVRAIEVIRATGRPFSEQGTMGGAPDNWERIGLTMPRAALYQRLDERVDAMFAAGLVEEVRALRDAGFDRDLSAFGSVGYREVWAYLEGELPLDEAVQRVKFRTHRLVRQQYTWFRLDDPAIHWFDVALPEYPANAVETVERLLNAA